jgi:flagellar basal body L-ring protein FlgH
MIEKTVAFIICLLLTVGCAPKKVDLPILAPAPVDKKQPVRLEYQEGREFGLRNRNRIPLTAARYEGSLWRDESSWGNLLRDHRARFKNDVLTITNLQEIISISDSTATAAGKPLVTAGETQAGQAAKVLQSLNAAAGIVDLEKERNNVLRSFKQVSAQVVGVLPNGNMIVSGEKVDYRQQNSVRYVTKIRGIIRPEDVSSKNTISALMLARAEVNTKRQVQIKRINFSALAPLLGTRKTKLMDQVSKTLAGQARNKNTKVPTK